MKEKEEKAQKLYLEFQMLSQQIKHLENQNDAVSNQLLELMSTAQTLEEMNNLKENAQILVPISSGIYAKAELKDGRNFIVNVGANTALVKDLESTKFIISEQIKEMRKIQESLVKELQSHTEKASSLEQEINNIASEIQK